MIETLTGNPLDILARWVAEAEAAGVPMPSTMTLATADVDGNPHARTVLVTTIDDHSLRFHSSSPTAKTRDLADNPRVSAVFHWPALGRQAILTGAAAELDRAVTTAAYPTRPRTLQLVAWAYEDLTPALRGPDYEVPAGAVEKAFAAAAARDPQTLPAPASWTTIELRPCGVDFWQVGTETTPAAKTRFRSDGAEWRSFPVLP
ncbi:pyridoxal 5'-phosphate synthase [Occultella kanbiaonis]|uniref:pyridoxine/pyridoxamine 5'-phosphate oxidase n=1 Tax=Occultella kanbiaonis TaxID=2675754 RepID=UPI0013D1E565|nr:pyridoxamine 5'-phosphate oxidase family protein [Occultella kanbiaonis]